VTVYGLQKVCFDPYKSEKRFCLHDIDFSVMPRIIEYQRLRPIGMLQAGLAHNIVTRHFGVHRNTIQSLLRRFGQFSNTRDRQCLGRRSRVTPRQHDNHVRLVHLRDRFQPSSFTARRIPRLRPISSRTVDNILRDRHIRPRRPFLLSMRHAASLTWCRRNLRFRRQDWANILFTD
jgi:transposase